MFPYRNTVSAVSKFSFSNQSWIVSIFCLPWEHRKWSQIKKSPATPQELDSLSWMAAKSISRSSFWLLDGVQNRWREGPSRNKTLERRCKWRSSYGAVDRSVEKRSTFKGAKWQRGKMRYQLSTIDGWHSTKSLAVQIALQRKHNRNLLHNSW